MAKLKGIKREEVLRLRSGGLTQKQIAERLGCTRVNVVYHLYPNVRESHRRLLNDPRYRKLRNRYYRRRYRTDPEFRKKMLRANSGGRFAEEKA